MLRNELITLDTNDKRLDKRSIKILETLGGKPQLSIPAACNGWGETKAAYRLFDNDKITGEGILEPHRACTIERMKSYPIVLCIEDTSEIDYTGKNNIEGLGPLNFEARQGLYLHPMLAITPDRLCLGVLDGFNWSRKKGSLGKKKDTNRPIGEKESARWLRGYLATCDDQEDFPETKLVYITDREGDIYEIYEAVEKRKTAELATASWLIRGQHNRLLEDDSYLLEAVKNTKSLGEIEFDLPHGRGRKSRRVVQKLYQKRVTLKGVRRTGGKLQDIEVTVILAREENPPSGEKAVEWFLLTNDKVETFKKVAERISWYLCRWQIEIFFKVLKSGCKIEKLQLETKERLEVALAFYMIIAWQILYLTTLGRTCPDLPCDVVFETKEWQAAYIVANRQPPPEAPPNINEMIRMIATFGGFLNRKGDGEPGVKTLWIGLQRTRDFALAIQMNEALNLR
jgi:hypothetical protein